MSTNDGAFEASSSYYSAYEVFGETNKIGLKQRSNNEVIISPLYTKIIFNEENGIAYAYRNDSVGLYTLANKKLLVPVAYKYIEPLYQNSTYSSRSAIEATDFLDTRTLFIQENNNYLTSITGLTEILKTKIEQVYIINSNGKYGIYSVSDLKYLVPLQYTKIDRYKNEFLMPGPDGNVFVLSQDQKIGLYRYEEANLVSPIFDSLSNTGGTLIGWTKKKIVVFPKDAQSWETSRPKEIQAGSELIAFKSVKNQWELRRLDNTVFLKEKFDSLRIIASSQSFFELEQAVRYPIIAYKESVLYLIDQNDSLPPLIIPNGKYIGSYMGKYLLISSLDKKGVYNFDLQEILPLQFDQIVPWMRKTKGQEAWLCKKTNSWYFYDGSNIFDSIQADTIQLFDMDAYCAFRNGKAALINRKENVQTEFIYDFVQTKFEPGEKLARINQEYVYLSANGDSHPANITYSNSGYESLNELAAAFLEAVNSTDNDLLYQFADKLTPDYHSYEFMNGYLADYRSFFKNFSDSNRQLVLQRYYEKLEVIKTKILSRSAGQLLENKGFEDPNTRKAEINKKLTLEGTESSILFQAGEETFSVKLGELMFIDGKVKTFTLPKFN